MQGKPSSHCHLCSEICWRPRLSNHSLADQIWATIQCHSSFGQRIHYCFGIHGIQGQQFNATLLLGKEFTTALASMEFKDPHQAFPFCRAAIWATMLTTNKSSDGFAKVSGKADLDRLKPPTMLEKVRKAEDMLKDSWHAMQAMKAAEPEKAGHAHKVFGRMAVRTILYLASKEKHSREEWQWTTLGSIVQSFSDELQHLPAQGLTSNALAKDMPVADTVNAKPWHLAMLQNPHLQVGEQGVGNFLLIGKSSPRFQTKEAFRC